MCKESEEIQKLWMPKVGDCVWKGIQYLQIEDACGVITDINFQKNEEVWLPRQGQLQDMINEVILARYIKVTAIGALHLKSNILPTLSASE